MNDTESKIAIVVCASEFNKEKFDEIRCQEKSASIIAVDAGYKHLIDNKVTPDLVLGDFDSLGFLPAGVRTTKFPKDKDQSDLELALKRLQDENYEKAYVFGALGKRVDHTLSSIRACAFANRSGLEVEMIGLGERIILLSGEDAWQSEPLEDQTTISIIPALEPIENLFLRGLKWEADDLRLDKFPTIGQSNLSTNDPILIGLKSGTIAIVINFS